MKALHDTSHLRRWRITFDTPQDAHNLFMETILTLGNGFLGIRGAREESRTSRNANPVTLVAETYNAPGRRKGESRRVQRPTRLAVTPNWLRIRVHDGESWTGHRANRVLEELFRELTEYFAGERRSFETPMDLTGTPFQLEIWRALVLAPYGTTVTYGELAGRVGRPKAARAAGGACGANPLPIVGPCHRVLGAGGGLGGFTGGLDIKKRLLAMEEPFFKDRF